MTEFGENLQPEQSNGLPLDLPLTDTDTSIMGLSTPLASIMTLSELLPLNYATLAVAQAVYDNRITTTICFSAATLATELAGAIGSADLIEREKVNRPINWAHKKLEKISPYIGGENTGIATDFIITVAAGTVILNVLKKIQDPSRDRLQNRRYGSIMGVANSAVSATGFWLASEGVYHPNYEDVTISGLAVLSLLGITRVVKYKFKKNRNDEQEGK